MNFAPAVIVHLPPCSHLYQGACADNSACARAYGNTVDFLSIAVYTVCTAVVFRFLQDYLKIRGCHVFVTCNRHVSTIIGAESRKKEGRRGKGGIVVIHGQEVIRTACSNIRNNPGIELNSPAAVQWDSVMTGLDHDVHDVFRCVVTIKIFPFMETNPEPAVGADPGIPHVLDPGTDRIIAVV